jgi:hypothetical protein
MPLPNEINGPRRASLDRIDSSRGYVPGNVEWVCMFINYGKNSWSREAVNGVLDQVAATVCSGGS